MSESQFLEDRKQAFIDYLRALKRLKELGIINNKKDFTSQLGEWLVSELYQGKLAVSGKQKDWDLQIGEKNIQVKTHSKSKTTSRSNTDFKYSDDADIDILIIIVFDEEYKLKNIFEIPWETAKILKSKNTKDVVIRWKEIPESCRIDLNQKFPNNDLLKSFL